MKYELYLIYNCVNGKMYVGITKNKKRRWSEHRKHGRHKPCAGCSAIHYAIRKHKLENFIFKVVDNVYDLNAANQKEIEWIKELKLLGYQLYNETAGGDGTPGHCGPLNLSAEERNRRSLAITGSNNFFYGRKLTGSANGHYGHKMKPHVKEILLKHRAKLTPTQVSEIKSLHAIDQTQTSLSKQFGVSLTQIHRIVTEQRWVSGQPAPRKVKARLTRQQAQYIKDTYKTGDVTQQQLADKFNVSIAQVNRIVNGTRWKE